MAGASKTPTSKLPLVGNAGRIVIHDNQSRVVSGTALAGIYLEGEFGRHVAVRDNVVSNCRTGVVMTPRYEIPKPQLWVIADNLTPGAGDAVDAGSPVRVEGNVP